MNRFITFRKFFSLFLLLFLIVSGGCSKSPGNFAYKTFEMDSYRRMKPMMEFAEGEHVDWVYVFSSASQKPVGVIVMQKMAVWVDIDTKRIVPELGNPNIYGTLVERGEGEYRIVIVRDNVQVDEIGYIVYPKKEEPSFD